MASGIYGYRLRELTACRTANQPYTATTNKFPSSSQSRSNISIGAFVVATIRSPRAVVDATRNQKDEQFHCPDADLRRQTDERRWNKYAAFELYAVVLADAESPVNVVNL